MTQFLIQVAAFLIASLSSVGLIYISKSYQFYQQLIPVLLILDIAIASRAKSTDQPRLSFSKLIILFTTSLLVQTIVLSSGGFYSPLLIILHIFTLGAILLLGSSSPILFLVFSLGVLIFQVSFDRNLYQFFQNDPWAVAIYALSIVIVIPLALYLSHSNSVKTRFNNFLRDYIEMSEKRQKSILTALSNMVIITDKDLKILSINIAVERLFRISIPQIQNHPLSELLTLKDDQGNAVSIEHLPIEQALKDKATRIVEGYFLETRIEAIAKPITIQIRPLTNPSNEITQIVFVLTDPLMKIGFNTHSNIIEAVKKRDQLLSTIATKTSLSESSAKQTILLITHIEADILTTQEMEDHPLQDVIGFIDLISLIKQILGSKNYFYSSVGNQPELRFEDDDKSETAFLNLNIASTGTMTLSKYSAAVDSYLLKLILEKILDLAVIITGKDSKPEIYLSVASGNIEVSITLPNSNLTQKDLSNLFIKNYPGLKLPQLQKSSGLEGYIANKISRTLALPIQTLLNPYKQTLTFKMLIQKQAVIHTQNT